MAGLFSGTARQNAQNRRGDPYPCYEIYQSGTYNLCPSMTLRVIPVRTHDRNQARSITEYAAHLMTLLKSAAY
jgi:hypothetical protein